MAAQLGLPSSPDFTQERPGRQVGGQPRLRPAEGHCGEAQSIPGPSSDSVVMLS